MSCSWQSWNNDKMNMILIILLEDVVGTVTPIMRRATTLLPRQVLPMRWFVDATMISVVLRLLLLQKTTMTSKRKRILRSASSTRLAALWMPRTS